MYINRSQLPRLWTTIFPRNLSRPRNSTPISLFPNTSSGRYPTSTDKSNNHLTMGGRESSAQPNHQVGPRKRERIFRFIHDPRARSPLPPGSASQHRAPHIPSTTGSKDLWTQAYHKLPDELKQCLGMNNGGAADQLQNLQDILQIAGQTGMAKRLNLKWGGKEINVQETTDRLVGWITKLGEVGDIAAQYDPVDAVLPLAGVRFILLVRNTIHSLHYIHDLYLAVNLLNIACCWGSRKTGSSHCWNGAGCAVDWPRRHIRAALSHRRYPKGCRGGYGKSPQGVTHIIHGYIGSIVSIDTSIPGLNPLLFSF